ncbi:unnamed protein product, partial [Protopolystoma xenopodis]
WILAPDKFSTKYKNVFLTCTFSQCLTDPHQVYVVGGFEGRRYHDSAEFYEPDSNQWTMISRMHSPRGGVSLAQHGGYLFAIGGNDGNSRLRSIERYDNSLSR